MVDILLDTRVDDDLRLVDVVVPDDVELGIVTLDVVEIVVLEVDELPPSSDPELEPRAA